MSHDQDIAEIVAKLTDEFAFKTIDMQVETLQSSKQEPKPQPRESRVHETYLATKEGQRFYDERAESTNYRSHEARYCDGRKCASVYYAEVDSDRQSSIHVSHAFPYEEKYGFLEAPRPYVFSSHVGLTPLREALPSAERMGAGECIGRECLLFHFKAVGPRATAQSLLYYLDKATAVPLKVEAFDGPDRLREKSPNWVWEAVTLDPVGKRHFPLKSTYSNYVRMKNADGTVSSSTQTAQSFTVTKLEFDRPIPSSTFWPIYQSGVEVSDSISKRHAAPEKTATSSEPSQGGGMPIRVEESGNGGVLLSTWGVALGLVILFVATVLWRRSR